MDYEKILDMQKWVYKIILKNTGMLFRNLVSGDTKMDFL